MDQSSKRSLDFFEAHDVGLAEQQRQFRRKIVTTLDQAQQCVGQVVEMQEWLARRQVPGIHVGDKLAFVDARDLMAQERRVPKIVVDARRTQQHDGNVVVLFQYHLLGTQLGRPVGKPVVPWRRLVDTPAVAGRRMCQQRAHEDELIDFKVLQGQEQSLGALDRDRFIEVVGFAGEIEISSQMDHGCDFRSVCQPQAFESGGHAVVRRQIHANALRRCRRMRRTLLVEANQVEMPGKLLDHGRTDESAATGDDHRLLSSGHACLLRACCADT